MPFTSSKGIKENTEENRRRYRQILFATPKEDMEAIAGVILQHETCYQQNDDGVPLLKLLKVCMYLLIVAMNELGARQTRLKMLFRSLTAIKNVIYNSTKLFKSSQQFIES